MSPDCSTTTSVARTTSPLTANSPRNPSRTSPSPRWLRSIRSFLRRVVRLCVGDRASVSSSTSVRGIPTAGNVHEVAHQLDPSCRVVYVDHDPWPSRTPRTMLRDNRRAAIVQADLRDAGGRVRRAGDAAPDRLQPADRRADDRRPAVHPRLRCSWPGASRATATRWCRAASVALTHLTKDVEPELVDKLIALADDTAYADHRHGPSRTSRSSSRDWTCSTPVWCSPRTGVPTASCPAPVPRRRPPATVPSASSRGELPVTFTRITRRRTRSAWPRRRGAVGDRLAAALAPHDVVPPMLRSTLHAVQAHARDVVGDEGGAAVGLVELDLAVEELDVLRVPDPEAERGAHAVDARRVLAW